MHEMSIVYDVKEGLRQSSQENVYSRKELNNKVHEGERKEAEVECKSVKKYNKLQPFANTLSRSHLI